MVTKIRKIQKEKNPPKKESNGWSKGHNGKYSKNKLGNRFGALANMSEEAEVDLASTGAANDAPLGSEMPHQVFSCDSKNEKKRQRGGGKKEMVEEVNDNNIPSSSSKPKRSKPKTVENPSNAKENEKELVMANKNQ